MKKTVAIITILLILLTFGCIETGTNDSARINHLKEKYSMQTAFSQNDEIMLAYINDLVLENMNSNLANAELYSAQSFYYVLMSMKQASNIQIISENCKSPYLIKSYQAAKLSESAAIKAIEKINSLSKNEQELLRVGQKEMIEEYLTVAQQIKTELKQACSNLN